MKKIFLVPLLALPLLIGCSKSTDQLSFAQSEYSIQSGDKVTIEQDVEVTYEFLSKVPDDVRLDNKTGLITFDSNLNAVRQVYYRAFTDDKSSNPVVINLTNTIVTPTVTIDNPTEYISDGEYIVASSSTGTACSYTLEHEIGGVLLDNSSGRVSFTSIVGDDLQFEVVATSHGVSTSKIFKAARTHLVTSPTKVQAVEAGSKQSMSYQLDFSDALGTEKKILAIYHKQNKLSHYVFNPSTCVLTIAPEGLTDLFVGENDLRIITPRNTVIVNAIVASKFISTPEDLASINGNQSLLNGYLLLANDIDMTSYFADEDRGYNGGKYWTPIGLYHDTQDITQFKDVFGGTFNGNGYSISGLKLARHDEYGFNAGLFGYVNSYGHIKNLSLIGDQMDCASYSGGFVGVNEGIIENCYSKNTIIATTGDTIERYKISGGFVGRNVGTISDCVCVAKVTGDDDTGLFCGSNEGLISNCYATHRESIQALPFTNGTPAKNSSIYTNESLLIDDFASLALDKDVWNVESSKLVISHEIPFFEPYSIQLSSEYLSYAEGETISYITKLLPSSVHDDFIDDVTYDLIGEGAVLNPLTSEISTTEFKGKEITLVATLVLGEVTLTESITFSIYEAIQTLEFTDIDTNVEPGMRYRIGLSFTPETSTEEIQLSATSKFVHFDRDVMSIDSNISVSGISSFMVNASTKYQSIFKSVNISYPLELKKTTFMMYQGEENDIAVELPNSEDYSGAKMYRFSKETKKFIIQGNTLFIDQQNLDNFVDNDVYFTLRLTNGKYIKVCVTYVSHRANKQEDLTSPILISTKNEMLTYFNQESVDAHKYLNYSKNYVLLNDISYGGESIRAIGGQQDDECFSGTFYGLNHKISDFIINQTENGSQYVLGFFSKLRGKVCDVTFSGATIDGKTYVGGLAGVAEKETVVENVNFLSSTVSNVYGHDYGIPGSEEHLYTGRIIGYNEGKISGCSFNKSYIGLVGF